MSHSGISDRLYTKKHLYNEPVDADSLESPKLSHSPSPEHADKFSENRFKHKPTLNECGNHQVLGSTKHQTCRFVSKLISSEEIRAGSESKKDFIN
jgi:hypothetical protein